MGQENSRCSCPCSREENDAKFEKHSNDESPKSSTFSIHSKSKKPEPLAEKNLKSYVNLKNNDISHHLESISDVNNSNKNAIPQKDDSNTIISINKKSNSTQYQNNQLEEQISKEEKDTKLDIPITTPFKGNCMSFSESYFHKNSSNPKQKFQKNYDINNIIKIQAVYLGSIYRHKKLHQIKKELNDHLIKMTKKLYQEYLKPNLIKQEQSLGIEHNEDSYKTLYSTLGSVGIGSALSNELRLKTKLLILEYNKMASFYVGEVNIDNKLNGKGILMQEDGTKYNGTFENNLINGIGTLIDSEGTLYEGFFSEGKLDGKGTKKMLNGCLYNGYFVEGLREGKGKEETSEFIYEGSFLKDKKNGKGKLTYKELNDIYEGEFKDNSITGEGIQSWGNGEKYEGTFLSGKKHGKGTYYWPDGSMYQGDYIDNVKEGKGFFKWKNGKEYRGDFKGGKPSGKGILKTKDKKFEVIFKDGKLVGKVLDVSKKKNDLEQIESDKEEEEKDFEVEEEEYEKESEELTLSSHIRKGNKNEKTRTKEHKKEEKWSEENSEEEEENEYEDEDNKESFIEPEKSLFTRDIKKKNKLTFQEKFHEKLPKLSLFHNKKKKSSFKKRIGKSPFEETTNSGESDLGKRGFGLKRSKKKILDWTGSDESEAFQKKKSYKYINPKRK